MRFLGRISAISRVTSRWSHFLVHTSEIFSRPAVTFSRSNFGTFLEGSVYVFSAILGVQTPASLWTAPKNMILARSSDTEVHRKRSVEAFLVDLCLATVTSCNKKIVACKFRRYDRHTHVLVTTRKAPGRPDRSESSV